MAPSSPAHMSGIFLLAVQRLVPKLSSCQPQNRCKNFVSSSLTRSAGAVNDFASSARIELVLAEETHEKHEKLPDDICSIYLGSRQRAWSRRSDSHFDRRHRNHRNPQPLRRQRVVALRNF